MTRLIHILSILFFMSVAGYGQGDGDIVNDKIKGMYMYQFAKNVNWSNKEHTTGDFIIGVLGDKGLYEQISSTYSGKPVGSQTIKVKFFDTPTSVTNCHILYIAEKYSSKVPELSKKYRSGKTLIVSYGKGQLAKGSIINFIIKDNMIAFEISKTNASKKDVEISQMLIKLAKNVI